MLEETVKRTALGLMGLHLDKPLHLGLNTANDEEMRDAYDTIMGNGNAYFYDSFGSTAIITSSTESDFSLKVASVITLF